MSLSNFYLQTDLVIKVKDGSFPLPKREFLNVNIPMNQIESNMTVTYAGYRYYENESHVHENPRGEKHYWLGLHPLKFAPRVEVDGISDYEAIEDGFISITPIMLDLSAYKSMDKLIEWIK